jgi:hypothetical protein
MSGRSNHAVPNAHLSPVQHMPQSIYLTPACPATSVGDHLYHHREYMHPTVYVTSPLTQPYFTQSQKYVLASNPAGGAAFCPAGSTSTLPAPPPAHHHQHHHSSRAAIAPTVGYAPASVSHTHPLPAHLQPAPSGQMAMPFPGAPFWTFSMMRSI